MANRILKDRYEIIAELGKGGMSTVYLARDQILGSYWAVKQVKKNASVDIGAFKKEVELLSSLNHSDIPRIVDRIEVDDDYFVCMDFVDGVALSKKVKTEGPIPESDVVQYMFMLCDILEYLHTAKENPIVYRDIKPENIMLTPAGRIKLIDFGIAKECVRGEKDKGPKVGTKGYAAPEQYEGGALDERTDIYSVGVTIFTLVTGKAPAKPMKKGQIVTVPPIREINPSLSEGLEYIVEKCTEIDPSNRYQNCEELRYDLENIEKLNSQYRKSMGGKLAAFASSLLVCVLSVIMMFVGFTGNQRDISDNYQYAYNQAVSYEKEGKYAEAYEEYMRAIGYRQSDSDAYIRAFYCDLSRGNDGSTGNDSSSDTGTGENASGESASDESLTKTKIVIDKFKKYVDESYSEVYRNPQLMYTIAKQCMMLNDSVYAGYASEYFDLIKQTVEYEEGMFSRNEIDSLYIIAQMRSQDWGTIEDKDLRAAMDALERDTIESTSMDSNDRISNYYNLIIIYNAYQNQFEDAYEKIDQLGEEADKVFRAQLDTGELEFVNVIDMYKLVAKSQYTSGINGLRESVEKSRENYINAIKWFTYMEDVGIDLEDDVKLEINKANAYRSVFETYTTSRQWDLIDSTVEGYLNRAIEIYRDILRRNPKNFTAAVNLTNAYISREQAKPNSPDINFADATAQYNRVQELAEELDLSNTEQMLLSSLKTNYQQVVEGGVQ